MKPRSKSSAVAMGGISNVRVVSQKSETQMLGTLSVALTNLNVNKSCDANGVIVQRVTSRIKVGECKPLTVGEAEKVIADYKGVSITIVPKFYIDNGICINAKFGDLAFQEYNLYLKEPLSFEISKTVSSI